MIIPGDWRRKIILMSTDYCSNKLIIFVHKSIHKLAKHLNFSDKNIKTTFIVRYSILLKHVKTLTTNFRFFL